MVSVDDFNKLNIEGDKLEKVMLAVTEFEENPTIKIEDLAVKHNIPRRSLYYYFKQLGLSTMGKGMSVTDRTVRKTELTALSDEAEKIATLAIGIGGPIARRYLPLLDYLLRGGKTLDMIATDLVDWYQMKITTEARILKLETDNQLLTVENKILNYKLKEAWAIAGPNFRYLLRAKLLEDFGNKILKWRAHGARIRRSEYDWFKDSLRRLDEDLGGVKFVRVTISPEKVFSLQKEHRAGSDLIRVICKDEELE